MKAFFFMNSKPESSVSIPRSGVVYMKSTSEQQNTIVWIKRDWDSGFDLRVSDYGSGQFSILRSKTKLYLVEELVAMGHELIEEDEFNNAFIDAASWILHNKPEPGAKSPRAKRSRKAKSYLQEESVSLRMG